MHLSDFIKDGSLCSRSKCKEGETGELISKRGVCVMPPPLMAQASLWKKWWVTGKLLSVLTFKWEAQFSFTTVDRERQKDQVFNANLGYVVEHCHKQQTCIWAHMYIYIYRSSSKSIMTLPLTQFQFYILKTYQARQNTGPRYQIIFILQFYTGLYRS